MTMTSKIAIRAIDRSISHDEIVTIDYDADAQAQLEAAREGMADVARQYGHTEYWGVTVEGGEWRVHVRVQA